MQFDLTRRVSNQHIEIARLGAPAVGAYIEIGKATLIKNYRNCFGFSGTQTNF